MSYTLRALLFIGGIVTAAWILLRIRRSKVKVEDAVFWFCLAVLLLVLGTFTDISFWLSEMLGIQSPANCVFLLIIALLIEKIFTLSIKLSQLEDKMEVLTAEVALRTKDLSAKIARVDDKDTHADGDSIGPV